MTTKNQNQNAPADDAVKPTQARLIRLQIAATIAAGLVDNPALTDDNVVERAIKLTDKLTRVILSDD